MVKNPDSATRFLELTSVLSRQFLSLCTPMSSSTHLKVVFPLWAASISSENLLETQTLVPYPKLIEPVTLEVSQNHLGELVKKTPAEFLIGAGKLGRKNLHLYQVVRWYQSYWFRSHFENPPVNRCRRWDSASP